MAHFCDFKERIECAVIILDPDTNVPRNCGYVTFKSREAAKDAQEKYEGTKLNGKYVFRTSISKVHCEVIAVGESTPTDGVLHHEPTTFSGMESEPAGISRKALCGSSGKLADIVEERLQCLTKEMLYLIYKFDSQEFGALRSTLPVGIFQKNGMLYLSGSSTDIQTATNQILRSQLLSGLHLELIHVNGCPTKVHRNILRMDYTNVECALYNVNDDNKCDVLLFCTELNEFKKAKAHLECLAPLHKSCYINPEALSLTQLPSMLSDLEAELPITIDGKCPPRQEMILHGICPEDIDMAQRKIEEYVERNAFEVQNVRVTAFQGVHYFKKHSEEAKKLSCEIFINPPDCKSLPPKQEVTLSISGSKTNVTELACKLRFMSELETKSKTRKKDIKDEVVGLLLTQPGHYLSCLKKKASDGVIELNVLPKPRLGFEMIGWPRAIELYEEVIENILKEVNEIIGCRQIVLPPSYLPFCSRHECRESVRKRFKVVASFSSDRDNVIAQVCFRVRQDHIMTLKIVEGNLSAQKVDAIVVPTGRSTTDLYPIELPSLAKQVFQVGYSKGIHNPSGLTVLGQTGSLDGGDLPCQYIIHTLTPLGEAENLHETVSNSLIYASKAGSSSVAFPEMTPPQIVQSIIDALIEVNSTTLVSVSVVVGAKHQAKMYVEALNSIRLPAEESCYIWAWMNDLGSYTPYAKEANDALNDAYNRDSSGMYHQLKIGKHSYIINFSAMTQVNFFTQNKRVIRKQLNHNFGSTVTWQYLDDQGILTQYSSSDSAQIETMFQNGDAQSILIMCGRRYRFDFGCMKQINASSGYKRDINRKTESEKASHLEFLGDDKIVVNLRGPAEFLVRAKEELCAQLEAFLCSKDVRLPSDLPQSLHHKLRDIARKHQVDCVIKESSESEASAKSQHILAIKGSEDLVQQSITEIQEEIISFLDSQGQIPKLGATIYPEDWEPHLGDEQCKFIDLLKNSADFGKVYEKMMRTLPNVTVLKVQKVQNKWLWEKYIQTKKRLHEKNAGRVNEMLLFHGSRQTPAKDICASESGFDMRYSREGMWGQANYFAMKASYSDNYAHDIGNYKKEIILADVLTGDSYKSSQDSSLRLPPEKPNDGGLQLKQVRYDSVNGETYGCRVYMTYSNEYAYPAYVVTYSTYPSASPRPMAPLPARPRPQAPPSPPHPTAPPSPPPPPPSPPHPTNKGPSSCTIS